MQTSMDGPSNARSGNGVGGGQVAPPFAQVWWLWLLLGIFWIVVAVVILQFRSFSLTTVGIVVGLLFLIAGIEEFFVATVSGGWRWLWIVMGIILVIAGIVALFNPVGTFLALADIIGFLFVLIGVFWMVEAFATEPVNPVWWLGLISGIIMVILGFWAGGQFFATKAYLLLVFAGIWLLLRGITDIIKAFQIRRVGTFVATLW
ncbi:MAG: HdeD family acid-resistance protein [Ktedonobacterales bacterium]